MLLALTALFFVLTILCIAFWDEDMAAIPGFLFLVFLAISIFVGIGVVNGRALDSKIAMYIEENENIETEMNTLVEQYMNYESNTYGDLKGESSITLVSLYPELKTDALVTKQLDVYINNNKKIRELKENKIDLSVKKWWLYFGKQKCRLIEDKEDQKNGGKGADRDRSYDGGDGCVLKQSADERGNRNQD